MSKKPLGTVTTVDHHSLVTSHLIKFRGICKDGQRVPEPMPTITAGGMHVGEVRAFLIKYCGTALAVDVESYEAMSLNTGQSLMKTKSEPYTTVFTSS